MKFLRWIETHAAVFLVIALICLGYLGAELISTQHSLGKTQHSFAVTQKESTATRVTTVSQRCELTELILERPGESATPRGARLKASHSGCEKQLRHVKEINARTPTPR